MSGKSKNSSLETGWMRLLGRGLPVTLLVFGALLLGAARASANYCEVDGATPCTVDTDCPSDRCVLVLDMIADSPLCMNDIYLLFGQGGDLNCTSNELQFVSSDVNIIDGCDFRGDTATIELTATMDRNGGGNTYDVGVYLGLQGDALTGPSCDIFTFPYAPTTVSGSFQTLNGEYLSNLLG